MPWAKMMPISSEVAGLKKLQHQGPARVFESEERCLEAVRVQAYAAGDVIVIRNEGPRGGPGMREMLGITALIYGRGNGEKVALITPGRFSGATRGMCIGYVCPEAVSDGPIGLLRDGDVITIDARAEAGSLTVALDEGELTARRAARVPSPSKPPGGLLEKYAATVGPAIAVQSRIAGPSTGNATHERRLHRPRAIWACPWRERPNVVGIFSEGCL
jgi:dihydroxy-acid dehydratase